MPDHDGLSKSQIARSGQGQRGVGIAARLLVMNIGHRRTPTAQGGTKNVPLDEATENIGVRVNVFTTAVFFNFIAIFH